MHGATVVQFPRARAASQPLSPSARPNPLAPEPARLYLLAVLYLVLHAPEPDASALNDPCLVCDQPWPCDSARLAYRLLEGF